MEKIRNFYFKFYIGATKEGFEKYYKEVQDYGNFVMNLEREIMYGK